MKLLVDTSAYSQFNRGDARLQKWITSKNELVVPTIVVGELRAGFAAGGRQKENEMLLQKFLDSPNVSTLTITDATTKCFAAIYLNLRQLGKSVGTNDMWIAAMAMEHDIALLSTDKDFKHIKSIKLAKL